MPLSMFDQMLSGAALDDLIRVHGQVVTVQRVTETPDEYGSETEVWNDLIASLPCHFYALSGREVEAFRKLEVDANYGIVCKPQTEMITEKDRVIKETSAGDPGAVEIDGKFYLLFDIVWVQPISGSKTGCLRLALRQRK